MDGRGSDVSDIFILCMKEGGLECYSKYIDKNYFSHFLSMQCTNRCYLAPVVLSDCQEGMVAR